MAKQSPGYPHLPLNKAIERAKNIFDADRTNVIDRETAAEHVGYSSISGASEKMLSTLAHYGLIESAGKGQTKITNLGLDIYAPESEASKKLAIYKAGKTPSVFTMIDSHFDVRPSESSLRNWLIREQFVDRAIQPVMKAYFKTMDYIEQSGALESGGPSSVNSANDGGPDGNDVVYGGAKVGNLIQWEIDGVLQLPKPTRVRHVHEDGEYLFVDGSETGIPMSQVTVEQKIPVVPPHMVAPILPLSPPPVNDALPKGSFILSSGKVKDVSFEVRVTGEVNQTVIDRIVKYLELAKDDYAEDE